MSIMQIDNIANLRPRGREVIVRIEKSETVEMDGSVIAVVPLPSGLVLPVSDDADDNLEQHNPCYIHAIGPKADTSADGFPLSIGMRVYLAPYPERMDFETADGSRYCMLPVTAVRFGFEVITVGV